MFFIRAIQNSLIPATFSLSVLACGAANAASFNWSFTNTDGGPVTGGLVSGAINGLSEGTNVFEPSTLPYGITIDLNESPNGSTGLYDPAIVSGSGGSITVSGGEVTDYNFSFFLAGPAPTSSATFSAMLGSWAYFIFNPGSPTGSDSYFGIGNILGPTSSVTAPGPLPVFGASMAFGWSRRLRKRVVRARHKTAALTI